MWAPFPNILACLDFVIFCHIFHGLMISHAWSPLHTAAALAVRAAVKTERSLRNDTIRVIFCAASTSKDNANVALASSNS